MTLPAVTRATIRITGNPFPVGGRLAACSDMEAMGLTPVRSAKDRERSKRQAQDCEPYPGETKITQHAGHRARRHHSGRRGADRSQVGLVAQQHAQRAAARLGPEMIR